MPEDRRSESEKTAVNDLDATLVRRELLRSSANTIITAAAHLTTKTHEAIDVIAGQVEVLREAFPVEAATDPADVAPNSEESS